MQLEMLRGKMDGRGKPKVGAVMKGIELKGGIELEEGIEKMNVGSGGKLPPGLGKAPPPPE